MKKTVFLCVLQLSLSTNVFAHGMNKPGPHGGYIKMPGAFHTELVQNDNGSFKVYLLDLNFKNPMTKDSSVNLIYLSNKKNITFDCKIADEASYLCSSKEVNEKMKVGNIEIKAMRAKAKGVTAKYSLPLKLQKM